MNLFSCYETLKYSKIIEKIPNQKLLYEYQEILFSLNQIHCWIEGEDKRRILEKEILKRMEDYKNNYQKIQDIHE